MGLYQHHPDRRCPECGSYEYEVYANPRDPDFLKCGVCNNCGMPYRWGYERRTHTSPTFDDDDQICDKCEAAGGSCDVPYEVS